MKIVGYYSHAKGEEYLKTHHPEELAEIKHAIEAVDAERCRLKTPEGNEAKKLRREGISALYSPPHLNAMLDYYLWKMDWSLRPRVVTHDSSREGYREMDAHRNKVGVEIQFGKYAFLTYDIIAKMPIFKNSGIIDCGVEICAMAEMLPMMSSGIGAFEQVRWDLEARGLQSGDIPVLIIGIAPDIYPLGSRHAMALAEPQQQDLYEKALMPALNPNSTFELDRMENLPYYTLKYIEATGFPLPPDLILPTKTSRKSPGPRGKPGPKKKTGP